MEQTTNNGSTPPSERGPNIFARAGQVGHAIVLLLGWTFGSLRWTPPSWLQGLAAAVRRRYAAGVSIAHARPRVAALAAVGVCVLTVGGLGVGYWLRHRPQPLRISVTADAPGLTPIEEILHPQPLRVRFGGSAARLERIGKVVTQGIRLSPDLPGEWKFEDDRTLTFRPSQDWSAGQEYEVKLDSSLFPEHMLLEKYQVEFKTAPFEARIIRSEFYQDPSDPKVKVVVAALSFTHQVDKDDLAKRISLHKRGETGGVLGLGGKKQPFALTFNKLMSEAYIRSEPIPIPLDNTAMIVTVGAGVRAARGGNVTAQPLSAEVAVPGMFNYFRVNESSVVIARNERLEPEQVIVLDLTAGATEKEIDKNVEAWILPKDRPATEGADEVKNYSWGDASEIGPEVLSRSTKLSLAPIPTDRDDATLHSFKISAPVKAHVLLRMKKGTKSFGGYVLAKEYGAVIRVPSFPKEVKIAQPGALLSLSGEKKVSILARDIEGLRFEVARVLPGKVAELVTQAGGTFAEPRFQSYRFGPDDLTERFEEKRTLQKTAPGKAQYTAFDLGEYLDKGGARRGLFFFKVESWDPEKDRGTGVEERRFLLVTDLGLIVKRNADSTRDVFVQSVATGAPMSGVNIQVLGRNGLAVLTATTDGNGHARLAPLDDFQREKTAVALLARRGDDLSFLPIEGSDRDVEVSRFDVGGIVTGGRSTALDAYLFSDRGLYRPGDRFHVAFIIKPPDWQMPLEGVPLEAAITDPRGIEVQKEKVALPDSGFAEVSYKTEDTSPTGNWSTNLYLVEADGRRGALLGSRSVRVEEFLPDRMRINARFSTERVEGWVSPKDLAGQVSLQNLFGTPAESRRVAAELTLTPARPAFRAWKDYVFTDPLKAKNTFTDRLGDQTTNEKGEADFPLGLERFEKGSYQVTFSAEGYEAGGGRSVNGTTTVLVSPLPYLVGYKADGDLGYVSRGADRSVRLVAVGPDLSGMDVKELEAELLEIRWVSVLVRRDGGTYRYESTRREISRVTKPLALSAKGTKYALPTGDPGDFAIVVRDPQKVELAKISFSVAGAGNVTRSLEKNAELQVKLSRADWSPGEEIELQITAPYVGSGLITIEKEKVYSWKWFTASTTSSVQTIEVPAELEGNGYVSVTFVRAIDSEEIFVSPLSHGIAPFSVSRARRENVIALQAPEVARPGEPFKIKYHSSKPGKAVVFAVDEGILQVARYETPNPIAHFFQKRALEVRTRQILDLILPEFSIVQTLSASGGDDEARDALAKNLNPFKRKRDKPAVYWSGIVDIDSRDRELTWMVPETFNGAVRVMAVAVSTDAVGAAAKKALVRGHFVLTPNAPTFVAPGDEFEVSVGVSNNVEGSGKAAKVQLVLETTGELQVLDSAKRSLEIGEGREASATFKLRAKGKLGSASLRFAAHLGDKRSKQSVDLSVRPAVPYETLILSGRLLPGKSGGQTIPRQVIPDLRTLEASLSPLPLGLARGLTDYLSRFPYGCTEQLISQAFPAILLGGRPEFGFGKDKVSDSFSTTLRVLRARQNGEGAFGMWAANGFVSEFQNAYALHFLTEAKERQLPVPPDIQKRGLDYLRTLAGGRPQSIEDARAQAYAIYVLARNGVVTTSQLSALRDLLETKKDWAWKTDLTAVYMAGTYSLLKQKGPAVRLISEARMGTPQVADYEYFYDGLVYDAQLLYILARHFPERLAGLPENAMQAIADPIAAGHFNTLSSAYAILALDAYVKATGTEGVKVEAKLAEILASGKSRQLALPNGLFPKVAFSGEAAKLEVESTGKFPIYWQATVAGFDATLPKVEVKQKLELFREYRSSAGKPVTAIALGEEIEVHLKIRSLEGELYNVALVDLLPGGFEPVLEDRTPPAAAMAAAMADTESEAEPHGQPSGDDDCEGDCEGSGDYEGDGDDGPSEANVDEAEPAGVGALPIGTSASTWQPDYADVREDRVVIYGSIGETVRDFVYRIKATNQGLFTIPPAYAESMYDRTVKARGLPSKFKVVGGGD